MSDRFFLTTPLEGQRATLEGDEARHLAGVMRAAPGDLVTLFDGSGAEFVARVETIKKHSVELAVLERRLIDRDLPILLTLAVALPKGERQKWLVEKLTELGVTRLIPLATERGVAQPVEAALDRLQRGVVEASKQCGRNRLLEVAEPVKASEFFADRPAAEGVVSLIADPSGIPLVQAIASDVPLPLVAAIGPEGGFSPAELAAACTSGWQCVQLGPRILRIETAAVAIAAWAALRCS